MLIYLFIYLFIYSFIYLFIYLFKIPTLWDGTYLYIAHIRQPRLISNYPLKLYHCRASIPNSNPRREVGLNAKSLRKLQSNRHDFVCCSVFFFYHFHFSSSRGFLVQSERLAKDHDG